MAFSSISFLYYFLPVVLLLYFMVPFKANNFVLLISSLFFYFYGEPVYLFLMVAVSFTGYIHGLWINRSRNGRYAKISLISSVLTCLAPLLFFKYTDFAIKKYQQIVRTGYTPDKNRSAYRHKLFYLSDSVLYD